MDLSAGDQHPFGPKRFGDLKRLIAGISEKVLIQQLRELTAAGVLVRHDYQQVPPKVAYTMTAFGLTLVQALLPLHDLGDGTLDPGLGDHGFAHAGASKPSGPPPAKGGL